MRVRVWQTRAAGNGEARGRLWSVLKVAWNGHARNAGQSNPTNLKVCYARSARTRAAVVSRRKSMVDICWIAIDKLTPNGRNARTHSRKQIRQIADSISAFGFVVPILIDDDGVIIAGHGRYDAARLLDLKQVPAIKLRGLSEAKRRALALADNKIAENAGWDRELLAIELPELAEILVVEGLDVSITGFSAIEIDQLATDFEQDASDPDDTIDPEWATAAPVSKRGDLWDLGNHRLLCGDGRNTDEVARLMGGACAAMAFLDPPYNVRVRDVVGRGQVKHTEFAMASGELSCSEFVGFLKSTLAQAAAVSRDGAVHYVCMDWRHIGDLIEAGSMVYGDMLNLAVWVKSNAGQGSFYRSQHELVGIFRVGEEAHLNNVELGRHGRSRSNVWHYAGVNTFRAGRLDELKSHPTVKPVALVADAVRDCTRRGDVVLDIFGGSGTTILAAERVGRRAYTLEIEPRFVDVAIKRWQAFSGKDAICTETGLSFDEIASQRAMMRAAGSAPTDVR
jgi:DNA modification methylase